MLGRAKGNWNRAKKILGGSATTQETQIELLRDDQQSQLVYAAVASAPRCVTLTGEY